MIIGSAVGAVIAVALLAYFLNLIDRFSKWATKGATRVIKKSGVVETVGRLKNLVPVKVVLLVLALAAVLWVTRYERLAGPGYTHIEVNRYTGKSRIVAPDGSVIPWQ